MYKRQVWYRKAAERGFAPAQFNLGVTYERGIGIPIDYKEAVVWYRKAAEQGHAYAQYELGFMYVAGRGVTQDEVQARKWWSLAAKNGHTDARKALDMLTRRPRKPIIYVNPSA